MIQVGKVSDMAKLARIYISPEEEKKLTLDLQNVFTWVEELENLCLQAVCSPNIAAPLRDGQEIEKIPVQAIIGNAPKTYKDFFVVPAVMDMENAKGACHE